MAATTADVTTDGLTQVRIQSLTALAEKAHELSLRRNRIRSRRTDMYRSSFKGRGMEYDESRLYDPGDDTRHLDWRLMARTGEAHTKLFCEERERPVYFCVDYTAPMFFSTQRAFKSVVATHIAALLAWSAVHEGDRVGGVLFTDWYHAEVKPQRGKRGILQWLHQLAHFSVQDDRRDFDAGLRAGDDAFRRLSRLVRPGSMIFLISDFRGIHKQEARIRELAMHSELVFIYIYDPLEKALPPPGEYVVSDGEKNLLINSADKAYAANYARQFDKRQAYLKLLARKLRSGLMECTTRQDTFQSLQARFGIR